MEKALNEIITALEGLDNPNEALKLVAKALMNTGLELMHSPVRYFDFSVISEGAHVLWIALRSMRRLAKRYPEDTSVRAVYFSIYQAMIDVFVAKEFGRDLDMLSDEVESFVEERDVFLPVEEETQKRIKGILDLKHFHEMRWARNEEALNRHK